MSADEVARLQAAQRQEREAILSGSSASVRAADAKAALFWAFVGIRSPGARGSR